MKSSEIICRCEEITREELEAAIEDGASNLNELKRFTRAGMGLCQGRSCRRLVERIFSEHTGIPLGEVIPATFRQPVRPIRAEMTGEEKEE